MTKKIKSSVIITGLICLTLLEALALYSGIDGVLLTIVVAVIAATIGSTIPLDKVIK